LFQRANTQHNKRPSLKTMVDDDDDGDEDENDHNGHNSNLGLCDPLHLFCSLLATIAPRIPIFSFFHKLLNNETYHLRMCHTSNDARHIDANAT
jgi:hypothetical protein